MIKKFLRHGKYPTNVNLGLLIFRIGISAMMITHGWGKFQKVLNGDFSFGDPLGIGVEASLILAAFAEFICSCLLILGLTTRFAAIPLIVTMLVAWQIAHGDDPFSSQEKSVFYLLSYVFILITGPGKYSLDHKLFGKKGVRSLS
ncbi:DoxX family protein [Roseivirga spongicola]|uniref:DoxX family protein n=1 Tax=Roseivirga spongicola TaxID=333140 RepID=UPI0009FF9C53|nr:DoxX family protein [Roseivirga spongicola]WPZ12152.1 DoxX family protein [Roseivirga spongicola]